MCSLVEYRCRPELVHKLEENNIFIFLFYLNISHQIVNCAKETLGLEIDMYGIKLFYVKSNMLCYRC